MYLSKHVFYVKIKTLRNALFLNQKHSTIPILLITVVELFTLSLDMTIFQLV